LMFFSEFCKYEHFKTFMILKENGNIKYNKFIDEKRGVVQK